MDLHNNYHFETFYYEQPQEDAFKKGSPLHYLLLITEGCGQITTQADTVRLQAGSVCYIPKGLRCHCSWLGQPTAFLRFGFSAFPPKEQRSYGLQLLPEAEPLAAMLKAIPTDQAQISCESFRLFYDILQESASRLTYTEDPVAHTIADLAMAHIRQRPQATIAEIAHACAVSQPYLYGEFRRATGTTPNKYRTRILCQQAVELLTTTELTVKQISQQLGFSSPSYFRKVIRQATGQSPRQLRSGQSK